MTGTAHAVVDTSGLLVALMAALLIQRPTTLLIFGIIGLAANPAGILALSLHREANF
ncbi:hypothetical protein [Rothia aeria]|uniref:hypothetical protein n=1 Tax=Rothia aeria TaxID=172042 RepID=UPI00288A5EA5|nr:hypothetical protein [Rothia aeria]